MTLEIWRRCLERGLKTKRFTGKKRNLKR